MAYPSRADYAQAVGNFPHVSILDSKLRAGTPARGNNNLLIVYSGGFSSVFPLTVGSNTFALRCWIRDIGDTETRYQEISNYLKQRNLSYFVDFEFVPEGMLVNGTRWPITRMEWAEGETLCEFIKTNLHDSEVLRNAASEFAKMVQTLHSHKISHGDLQDGNILLRRIDSNVEIKLIDYDSLFVPALRGYPDNICGIAEYQHPKRMTGSGTANEKVDYFSELVIYLTLIALAENSDLWNQFGQREERALLFVAEDFKTPTHSSVFQELEKLSPDVRILASKLKEFCAKPSIDQLDSLESLLPKPPVSCSWPLTSGVLASILLIFIIVFVVRMNAKDDMLRELENQHTQQVYANQELESKNKELTRQKQELSSQLTLGEKDSKSAKIQIEELQGEITQLREKNQELKTQLDARPKQDQALQIENTRLIRLNGDLQKQLATRQSGTALQDGKNRSSQNKEVQMDTQSTNQGRANSRQLETRASSKLPMFSGEVAKTLIGHTSWVSSVAFGPGGNTLASGSGDNTVLLWNVATGTFKRPLKGHSNNVICVAFSPNGYTLASGSEDRTVLLWNVATRTNKQIVKRHDSGLSSIAFSPDGTMLASASDGDSYILLWDVTTGTTKQRLRDFGVTSVAFNPYGTTLASGNNYNDIRLWDVATGTTKRTLKGHSNRVTSVAFNPDGTMLASGSADTTVRVWNVAIGITKWTLKGHSDWVRSVMFRPDGRMIASGSDDRTIRLWNSGTGKHIRTLAGHTGQVFGVTFSPDGKTLASASADRTIRLWR